MEKAQKNTLCLELFISKWKYGFQFRSPGKFYLKPIKALDNSNVRTYPMEFYSFREDLQFYIHPPALYGNKMNSPSYI